jgi:hypothetical protein
MKIKTISQGGIAVLAAVYLELGYDPAWDAASFLLFEVVGFEGFFDVEGCVFVDHEGAGGFPEFQVGFL